MILVYKKSLLIVGIIFLVSSVGCSAPDAEISGTAVVSYVDDASVKRQETSRQSEETSRQPEETSRQSEESPCQSEESPRQEETLYWMDAYYRVLLQQEASQIQIVDVNFDGVPELFLLKQGVGSSSIYRGYSFKDEQLLDIKIQGGTMPSDLLLYREQETGETIWLAGGMFIYGETGRTYEYVWNQVDFSDLSDVDNSLFYGWRKTIELDGSVSRELLENGIYLAEGQEPYYENPVFSGYELVNTLSMNSYLEEFKMGDGFDRDMYYSFLELYEETQQENRQNGGKICSVKNENLLNPNLTGEDRLYLFSKIYRVLDEMSEININVKYLQVRHPDKEAQKKINDKLKSMAFEGDNGAEAIEAEMRVNFTIEQYASFYQNLLSVRVNRDCYFLNAPYPWADESAVTFQMDTGETIALSDILAIDNQLKDKLYSGDFAESRGILTHEDCVKLGLYDRLWDSLSGEDGYYDFYLNEDSIGFIVDVPHGMGDYWKFEAPIEKLGNLL